MTIDKDAILNAVKARPDKLSKREIAKELGLRGDQRRDLRIALSELVDAGKLLKSEQRRYRLTGAMPGVTILDVIEIDDDGDMVGIPAKWPLTDDDTSEPPRFRVYEKGARAGKPHERRSAKLGVGGKALCKLNLKNHTAEVITILGKSQVAD